MKGVPAQLKEQALDHGARRDHPRSRDMKKEFPGADEPAQQGRGRDQALRRPGLRAPDRAVLRPRRSLDSPTEVEKFAFLRELGFATPPHRRTASIDDALALYQRYASESARRSTTRSTASSSARTRSTRSTARRAQPPAARRGRVQVRVAGEGDAR